MSGLHRPQRWPHLLYGPVGRDVRHEYQDMFENFTCCVGSGMESHALHGDGIYYEAGDKFWINLYAPSTVDWTAAGVKFGDGDRFPARRDGHRQTHSPCASRVYLACCVVPPGPAKALRSRSTAKRSPPSQPPALM